MTSRRCRRHHLRPAVGHRQSPITQSAQPYYTPLIVCHCPDSQMTKDVRFRTWHRCAIACRLPLPFHFKTTATTKTHTEWHRRPFTSSPVHHSLTVFISISISTSTPLVHIARIPDSISQHSLTYTNNNKAKQQPCRPLSSPPFSPPPPRSSSVHCHSLPHHQPLTNTYPRDDGHA